MGGSSSKEERDSKQEINKKIIDELETTKFQIKEKYVYVPTKVPLTKKEMVQLEKDKKARGEKDCQILKDSIINGTA
jgi:hypothetical protein